MNASTGEASTRKTIDKAMQVLLTFSNREPELTLTEIADRLGMHKSIASRVVTSLCDWRMLERDPVTKRIRLGMAAWQLGMQVASQNALYREASPILGELTENTRHSAYVAILDRDEMLVVATVQSPEALRVTLHIGDRRPLHATAAGKLMLAHMTPEQRAAALERSGLQRLTRATLTTASELEAGLALVRRNGVAWNEGESVTGVGGVAAGVFDASGALIAAVSSVFPQTLVVASKKSALAKQVRDAAATLSSRFGWTGITVPRKSRA